MEQHSNDQNGRDPQLWKIAKKRAAFKADLAIYFVVNAFLWLIWLLTIDNYDGSTVPWPAWATAGWGIGMLFEYVEAYHYSKKDLAEHEYEKLKQQYK